MVSIKFDAYEHHLASASKKLMNRWKLWGSIFVVFEIVLGIVTKNAGVVAFSILFAGLALYIPAFRRLFRPMWATGMAARAFAADNNLRYLESAKPNYTKHFLPAIARVGMFERNEQVVKGALNSGRFRFGWSAGTKGRLNFRIGKPGSHKAFLGYRFNSGYKFQNVLQGRYR